MKRSSPKNIQAVLYSAFYDTPSTKILKFLQWVLASHPTSHPSILDMGCGPGRLLGDLAALGWKVTGMEPDEIYLAAAREKARSLPGVAIIPGGFEELGRKSEFDLVAGINGSFNYLTHPHQREKALQNVFQSLKPGGTVFLDMPNFPWILRNYKKPPPERKKHQGLEIEKHVTHEFDFHQCTLTHIDHFVYSCEDGSRGEEIHQHILGMMTFPEIASHLQNAGFDKIRTYNSWSARSSEPIQGRRMMISAIKPR